MTTLPASAAAEFASDLAEFDAALAELTAWQVFAAAQNFPALADQIAAELQDLTRWRDHTLALAMLLFAGPEGCEGDEGDEL
jgi:hypothetical protein